MIFPGDGTILRIDWAVTVFPEPDSPTTPNVSPLLTSRLMPSTALTIPAYVKKYVLRFSMCKTESGNVETCYSLSRGSKASLRPFPRRLKPITIIVTNIAGNRVPHHACSMKPAEVYICWPHVLELGAPNPRKLTAASVRMEFAI